MTTELAYLAHNNIIGITLWKKNTPLGESEPAELESVTRMTLKFRDVLIDSGVHTGVFDWSTGEGKLYITLEGQSISTGNYRARLAVYDPIYLQGLVWGSIPIAVYGTEM